MTGAEVLLALYLLGVAVALVRADAGWGTRLLLGLAWPLAPLAFALTVASLVAVGMVAFPLFGATVVALAGAAWYLL
ncbi:MAG: hypothetical protein AB7P67_12935 [Vicinamibacterales bacterium]